MNNVQQVFEQAFRNGYSHEPSHLVDKWLSKTVDGDYTFQGTRDQYAFFVLGLECGKVVARPGFKLVEVPLEPGDPEEAKEKALGAMMDALPKDWLSWDVYGEGVVCEALYDLGYRKVEG